MSALERKRLFIPGDTAHQSQGSFEQISTEIVDVVSQEKVRIYSQIVSSLLPPLRADTPDVERFTQIFSSRCSCLRAKAANPSGHLPAI